MENSNASFSSRYMAHPERPVAQAQFMGEFFGLEVNKRFLLF